jgi:hypothetical protein
MKMKLIVQKEGKEKGEGMLANCRSNAPASICPTSIIEVHFPAQVYIIISSCKSLGRSSCFQNIRVSQRLRIREKEKTNKNEEVGVNLTGARSQSSMKYTLTEPYNYFANTLI